MRIAGHLIGTLAGVWLLMPACLGGPNAGDLEYRNPPVAGADELTVTYMGTTTLIIADSDTTLIVDGYFTRAKIDLSTELGVLVEPDRAVIEATLGALGIESAAAVLVVHSHFDHSLDAPVVAELTGAVLLGSESTANVGRGLALPEERIRIVRPREPMRYGRFTVTFVINKHWQLPEPYASTMLNKSIDEPLAPPAPFDAYKDGETYSILFQHPRGKLLVHGSAGYLPGALRGVEADAVMLGTAGLGNMPPDEQENYYREIVTVTGAKRIFPIHWDVFTTPLTEPLVPGSDFEPAMAFLEKKRREAGVAYHLLPKGEPVALRFEER